MIDLIRFVLEVDIISFILGCVFGLVPSIGILIRSGVLFEYQEWRKRNQETKKWYNKVERTANGIERAWHCSGARPEKRDRKRTVEQMDDLTDELKRYRKHQNTTEEMREVMDGIIERWDDSRDLIRSYYSKSAYNMRGVSLSENAEHLKELLKKEQRGQASKLLGTIIESSKEYIDGIRQVKYRRRSIPHPYEIYRELKIHLSDDRISKFTERNDFLRIRGESVTHAVLYDQESGKYNVCQIDLDGDDEIVVIDELQGLSLSEDMLIKRLRLAESVDVIPYREVVPSEKSLEEFEGELE